MKPVVNDLGAAAMCSSHRSGVMPVRHRSIIKPLSELPKRLTSGGWRDLGVDLHRDGDLAMPQDLHGNPRMHVERSQQGAAGLPGAVARDPGNARHRNTAVEATVKVARLNRRTMTGRKDQ